MNKTININLSSVFFYVDESAYVLLTSYIKKLEKAFDETEGKDEILADVEARIAELFQEKKVHTNYVINEDDVTAVINILGQPEDFLSKEDDDLLEENKYTSKKKLFRDPDNKYIGGEASGF
jgi:superfamily II helicase